MPELLPLGISIGAHASTSCYVHPTRRDVHSVLRSAYGEESFPSSAFIRASDGTIEIGEEARRRQFESASLGTYLTSPVTELPDATPAFPSSFEPQTIISTVARQLRYMTASLHRLDPTFRLGTIAISAPASLVQHWKDPFDQACGEAGLELGAVVPEPEAVLTASLADRGSNPLPQAGDRLMILNWGHVSLEITTLEMLGYMNGGTLMFRRENHVSFPGFGGHFVNILIIDYLFRKFDRDIGDRFRPNERYLLLKDIEKAKITLTERTVRGIHDEVLFPGLEGRSSLIQSAMNPTEFSRLLKEPSEVLTQALDAVGANQKPFDHVIAVGGNSHLPFVRGALEKTLEPKKGSIWKFPLGGVFATQAVCHGTTLIASSIQNNSPRRVVIEQTLPLTGDVVSAFSPHPTPPADSSPDWMVIAAAGTQLPMKFVPTPTEVRGTGAPLFVHFALRTNSGVYHKLKDPIMMHDGMYALEPSPRSSMMKIMVENSEPHGASLSALIEISGYRIGPIPITAR